VTLVPPRPHLSQVSVQALQVLNVVSINKMCSVPHQSVHDVAIWVQGVQNGEHSLQTFQTAKSAGYGQLKSDTTFHITIHVNKHVDDILLGCDAAWMCRWAPTLRRNILPPYLPLNHWWPVTRPCSITTETTTDTFTTLRT
jgi:hypothetical protein